MRLLPDWRRVLARAWSVRLMAVAFVLTGLEAALPFLLPTLPVPAGVLALLAALVVGGAFVARLVAQSSLEKD